MTDPVNNRTNTQAPVKEDDLNRLGVKGRGGGELLVPSSVTPEGSGWSAGAEINRGYDDRYYNLGLEWKCLDTKGERGDGTASNNSLCVLGVVFGTADRYRGSGGKREKGSLIFVSGSEHMFGVVSLENDNSDHSVDGETNGNKVSEKGLYLSQTVYGALEIYAGDQWTFMPKAGLSMGTYHPFGGVEEQSQRFANPRNLSLLFSISAGYNDNNDKGTQKAPLNDLDVANEFAGDLVDDVQRIAAHNINAAMVRGQGLLKDNEMIGGSANQSGEDIPPFQAVASGFEALGVGKQGRFTYKAWKSGRRPEATIKLLEKGLTGLIFSIWGASAGDEGADLLSSGMLDLQVTMAGAMSISKIHPVAQKIGRFAVCGGLLGLGGEFDNDGIISGAMNGCLGMTSDSDATDKGVSARTYSYYPWTKFSGDRKGSRGVLRKLEHLPVARGDVNLLTESEIAMPPAGIGSAKTRGENAVIEEDKPLPSVGLQSSLRSGLGVEYELHLGDRVTVAPAVDVFMTQEFGSHSKVGAGAGAELGISIKAGEDWHIDLRSRAAAEHMFGGPTNTELMPLAVGLRFDTNNPFIFF